MERDQLFSIARKTLPLIQGCRADTYLEQGSNQQPRDWFSSAALWYIPHSLSPSPVHRLGVPRCQQRTRAHAGVYVVFCKLRNYYSPSS